MVVALGGCTTVETTQRPESYYTGAPQSDAAGLFKGEPGRLSDGEIERIINYRLTLPKQNRVAILVLSGASLWRFYSNDFVQLNEAIERDFIGTLKGSNRIYDASFLPALLVPENRTVGYLREGAARYQADLLLAYRTRCASYDNFRLLKPDETRAYCSVEAVLLDVRTGIVPFTSVSINNVEATKAADDKNLAETTKKNELAAINKSLGEVAKGLVRFLERVPVKQ
jgi:hypothetical protein